MKILEDIKKSELSSDRILEAAREKRDALATKGQKDAAQFLEQSRQRLEAQRAQALEEAKSELAKQRKGTERDAEKALAKLEKQYAANKAKAIKLLHDKLEGAIDAQD